MLSTKLCYIYPYSPSDTLIQMKTTYPSIFEGAGTPLSRLSVSRILLIHHRMLMFFTRSCSCPTGHAANDYSALRRPQTGKVSTERQRKPSSDTTSTTNGNNRRRKRPSQTHRGWPRLEPASRELPHPRTRLQHRTPSLLMHTAPPKQPVPAPGTGGASVIQRSITPPSIPAPRVHIANVFTKDTKHWLGLSLCMLNLQI